MVEVISSCRSCGAVDLEPVLSLGEVPLADALLDEDDLNRPEPRYPLDVVFCDRCSLVQLLQTVSPEVLFSEDYRYYSSYSDALLAHSRENALRLIESRGLSERSLVLEVASNDGYMLRNFVERGIPVVGIDPAPGPARAAEESGIPTLQAFFGTDLAARLRAGGTVADVVIANNVLAHVPDLNGFVAGIAAVLEDDGLAVVEVPYVRDLVDHCEFDTIYHEHLCYFSVSSLVPLFSRHGLTVQRVERYPIHGGSLRLYVTTDGEPDGTVGAILQEERDSGVVGPAYYRGFAGRVRRLQEALRSVLWRIRDRGKRIAAYGAAAKGTVLLNSTGIGRDLVEFVVDRNPHKHGRHMPGVRIPIHPPERLLTELPGFTLLLSWNFAQEVLQQQREYRARGGKFIIPIPSPTVV